MSQMLAHKRAIVTGGTRGIGRAIAEAFIAQGASVALFGTNLERGRAVVDELRKHAAGDQKIEFFAVNVGEPEQLATTMNTVFETFGSVDILVNNAGITRDNLLMRLSEEDWDQVLDVNLKSVFLACQLVVRPMMKARYGKIINITSVVGLTGNAGQSNYAASKAGMIGFTKSLAKEVATRGITVNCIAPGFIETDMTAALNEKQREAILAQIPMKKMGQATDIAQSALFLASSMADYITGQVITVDGGMVT